MDEEHKKLVEVAEDITQAMRSGLGKGAIEDAFQGLMDYTANHFMEEELLMGEHDFPGSSEHKDIHNRLTQQVMEYRNELFSKDSFNPAEFQAFISDWLINHILEEDRQYAEFINARSTQGKS
jgi:hemerythrin-like metal-binding protein